MKKTTKQVIEEAQNPEVEHVFVKYPGEEAGDVNDEDSSESCGTKVDEAKLKKYQKEHRDKKYTLLHTHPSRGPRLRGMAKFNTWFYQGLGKRELERMKDISALHSGPDLRSFLYHDRLKSAPVAVRDPDTGKVLGYNVLKKTKKTPSSPLKPEIIDNEEKVGILSFLKYKLGLNQVSKDSNAYESKRIESLRKGDPSIARKAYEDILDKYHLKSRFVTAKDYQVDEYSAQFVPKSGIEQRVSAVVIGAGFIASLLLLSSNITGFTILNLNNVTSNIVGAFLFIVSLCGLYFLSRRKK